MSSSVVDERVVQMRFDNDQFERNVKTSLGTLDKLKNGLNFDKSVSSVENLQSSLNRFSFSPFESLSNAADTVSSKFSALEVVAITALSNITNRAVDAGIQIAKSLTIDLVGAGWEGYGQKTQAVGTLVGQGYDIDTINAQLDKLMWYTDETSYEFNAMVESISKFTAAGQGLENSVEAMMGIANWAALSGQNATTASRAMYQLSQAMGAGVMRKEDYRSIQNASMDTTEFRQKAIDAALALGTLKEVSKGVYKSTVKDVKDGNFTIEQFANHLTEDAWFTSDVMMKVFENYAGAVDQIYAYTEENDVLASEAIEELGDALDEFQLKAFKAAQEARTFKDAVDAGKEAVRSQWTGIFEQIFGGYDTAKNLWTDTAEFVYDIFAAPLDSIRTAMKEINAEANTSGFGRLEQLLSGAGVNLDTFESKLIAFAKESGINIDGLIERFGSLEAAMISGAEGIGTDLLKRTVESLLGTSTNAVEDAARLTEENLANLQNVVYDIWSGKFGRGENKDAALTALGFTTDRELWLAIEQKVQNGIPLTMEDLASVLTGANDVIEQSTLTMEQLEEVAELLGMSVDDILREGLLPGVESPRDIIQDSLSRIMTNIVTFRDTISNAWKKIFPPNVAEKFYKIADGLRAFADATTLSEDQLEKLDKFFVKVFSKVKIVTDFISSLKVVLVPFSGILQKVIDPFKRLFNYIAEGSDTVEEVTDKIHPLAIVLTAVADVLAGLIGVVITIVSTISEVIAKYALPKIITFIQSLGPAFTNTANKIKAASSKIVYYLNAIKDYFASDAFGKKIIGVLGTVWNAIKAFRDKVRGTIAEFKTWLSGTDIGRLFKALTDSIKAIDASSMDPLQKLSVMLGNIKIALRGLGNLLGVTKLSASISSLFAPTKDNAGNTLSWWDRLKAKIEEMKITVKGWIFDTDGTFILFNTLKEKFEEIKKWFSEETPKDDGTPSWFDSIAKTVKEFLSGITAQDIVAFGKKLAAVAFLFEIFLKLRAKRRLISGAANIVENVGDIAELLKKRLQGTIGGSLSGQILKLAAAVALLVVAFKIVTGIDGDAALKGLKIMGLLLLEFVGMYAAIAVVNRLVGSGNIGIGFGIGILALVGAVALMVVLYEKVKELGDPDKNSVILLGALTGIISAGSMISGIGKFKLSNGLGMIAFVYSLSRLLKVYKEVYDITSTMRPGDVRQTRNAIILMVGGLALAGMLLGRTQFKFSNGAGMIMFVLALAGLALVYVKLTKALEGLTREQMVTTGNALGEMLLALALAGAILGKCKFKFSNGLGMVMFVAALAGLVYVYVKLLQAIEGIHLNTLKTAEHIILNMLGALVIAAAVMGTLKPRISSALSLIIFVGAIAILVYEWYKIDQMLQTMNNPTYAASVLQNMVGALIVMTAVLGLAAGLAGGGGWLLVASLSLIVMVGALYGLALVLAEIGDLPIDFELIKGKLASLGLTLLGLLAALAVVGVIGKFLGTGVLLVALSAVAVGGTMWLVIEGISGLLEQIASMDPDQMDKFFQSIKNGIMSLNEIPFKDGKNSLKLLTRFLGTMTWNNIKAGIAQFLGCDMTSFSEGLVKYGNAMPQIKDGMMALGSITEEDSTNITRGIEVLKTLLNALTVSDIFNNLTSLVGAWFTGEKGDNSTMISFAKGMRAYGAALPILKKGLDSWNISEEDAQGFLAGIKNLGLIMNSLSRADKENNVSSLWEVFAGEGAGANNATMQSFADGMLEYARAIPTLKEALDSWDLPADKYTTFKNGLDNLLLVVNAMTEADVSNDVNSGWKFFSGERYGANNETMHTFADGLLAYSEAIPVLKTAIDQLAMNDTYKTKCEKGVGVLKEIITTLTDADNDNDKKFSFWATVFGQGEGSNNETMKTFAQGMQWYAAGMRALVASMRPLAELDHDKTLTGIASVRQVINTLNNINLGDHKWLSTDNQAMISFGEGMVSYAQGISTIVAAIKRVQGLGPGDVETGLNEILAALDQLDAFAEKTSESKIQELAGKFSTLSSPQNIIAMKNAALALALSPTLPDGIPTAAAKWETMANNLATVFSVAIDSISNNTAVENHASNLASKAVSGFRSIYEDIRVVGLNVVVGFCNGMLSKLNLVSLTARSLALAAERATAETLGVRSPSREFMKIGEYVDKGFANGILGKEGEVTDAAETMANNVKLAAKTAMERANSIASSDLNPVITPVLDLSNVVYGAGQIGGILGAQRLSAAVSAIQNGSGISTIALDQASINQLDAQISKAVSSGVEAAVSNAINSTGGQAVNIYLDGRQIANTVSKYQRMTARALGV